MIFALLHLAASLAGTSLPPAAIVAAVEDVRAVALEEAPLFAGEDGRERTARLLLLWSFRESAWRVGAIGDNGESLGMMQMNRMWLADRAVLTDRRLALRLGLGLMRELAEKCGSVRGGLRAYASGSCSGSPRARQLVAWRCAQSGAC